MDEQCLDGIIDDNENYEIKAIRLILQNKRNPKT